MEIPRHRMIMILGDMNARVGRAKDSWPGIIGGYGMEAKAEQAGNLAHDRNDREAFR